MTDYFDYKASEEEIRAMSPLALAHVGDAVYELLVRAALHGLGGHSAGKMHEEAVKYVSAQAQACAAERLAPVLTQEEMDIYRRGRNTKVNSVPHNASVGQYHAATGLEALFGYLYMSGRKERINELFELIMEEMNAG